MFIMDNIDNQFLESVKIDVKKRVVISVAVCSISVQVQGFCKAGLVDASIGNCADRLLI
jgi:hypothetical protein